MVHHHQPPPGYFKTPFQDESQFIVETIVSDLAEQIFYAKQHRLPDPQSLSVQADERPNSTYEQPTYDLQVNLGAGYAPLETDLKIDGPIWSPEVYAGVASALAREIGLSQPGGAVDNEDSSLLKSLTDSTAQTIETENQSLSKALEADFNNSLLHEKAALLLGAFALREHSGEFYDIRSPLCGITAHLCMSQLLAGGKPPGINGQMARAILLTLMNDEVPALESLHNFRTEDPAIAAWTRTLQAYNTTDYRPIASQSDATPIERVAWFRACCLSADLDTAWDELSAPEKQTVDFNRVADENIYSVEIGHILLGYSLRLELSEIGAIYQLSHGKQLQGMNFIREMNVLPGRCVDLDENGKPEVRIIDWGQWAMFFQRHLGNTMRTNYSFLSFEWGVPDEAAKFTALLNVKFGGMRLYPFVKRFRPIPQHAGMSCRASDLQG